MPADGPPQPTPQTRRYVPPVVLLFLLAPVAAAQPDTEKETFFEAKICSGFAPGGSEVKSGGPVLSDGSSTCAFRSAR